MTRDEIFLAAFNQGYIIATESPILLKEVLPSMDGKTVYALGFTHGVKAAQEKLKGKKKGKGRGPGI